MAPFGKKSSAASRAAGKEPPGEASEARDWSHAEKSGYPQNDLMVLVVFDMVSSLLLVVDHILNLWCRMIDPNLTSDSFKSA